MSDLRSIELAIRALADATASGGGGGGGTVTSVAVSAPADLLSVSGSPVTTAGTIALTKTSQSQGLVYASPAAASGAPTFRTLASSDLPNHSAALLTSGTLAYDRMPAGSIIQTVAESLNVNALNSGGTFASTGLFLDITPVYTNSKLLLSFDTTTSADSLTSFCDVAIYRDGVNMVLGVLPGDAHVRVQGVATSEARRVIVQDVVLSGSTSNTEFRLWFRRAGGSGNVAIGRRAQDTNINGLTHIVIRELKQ
jgi:hypothetical protein